MHKECLSSVKLVTVIVLFGFLVKALIDEVQKWQQQEPEKSSTPGMLCPSSGALEGPRLHESSEYA